MARYLKYSNPRVPTLPTLLVLALLVAGYLAYNYRSGVLKHRNLFNSHATAMLLTMADNLRASDEDAVRVATVESLFGADTDKYGNHFRLELHGAAPDWAGTRLHATRDGRTVASLTVTSLRDGEWTTETERIPEWWQVWE